MIGLPHVASRAFNTPLLMHPGKARAILAGLGGRIAGADIVFDAAAPAGLDHVAFASGRPSRQMGRLGDPLGAEREYVAGSIVRVGPVAVIPIEGTLVHKGRWVGANSGDTSYEGIWAQIRLAAEDPSIGGVVFEVDSCGGEVSGAFDLADAIFELGQVKPTIAILTDQAYSAGYLLASAARAIVMPDSGGAGSIGVVVMHADFSGQLEREGIKVTVLTAGEHKMEGHPFAPLPDAVAAKIQRQIEAARITFAKAVARYRAGRFSLEQILATEAQDYDAVDDPVGVGLVDAIGRPSEALDAFVAEIGAKPWSGSRVQG